MRSQKYIRKLFIVHITLGQQYIKQELESGCVIEGGKFHQRCACKAHESYCKTYCDASEDCKGYVGPVYNEVAEYNGCQFATTGKQCPQNCSLLDEGVGVKQILSRGDKARSKGYPGCYIKLKRKLH